MASFFHTLKLDLVRQRRWTTRDEAQRNLFASSERYCNRQPIHSALGATLAPFDRVTGPRTDAACSGWIEAPPTPGPD